MMVSEWHICAYEDEIDEEQAYINDPNLLSIKIHHGGYFTNPPNKQYKKGTFNYFYLVDVDLFSVIDLIDMLCQLDYERKDIMHYHYKIPKNNLDHGLQALASDVNGSDMGQGNDIGIGMGQGSGIGQGSDRDDDVVVGNRLERLDHDLPEF
ncbi:hypothetical protein Tco_1285120 [Tanacetum coccineum]